MIQNRWLRRAAAATVALFVGAPLAWGAPASAAENAEIAKRRAAERRSFTDAEITDGFFKIMFAAEFVTGGAIDGIRRYDQPVRVFVENRARPDRSAAVHTAVDDIRKRVRHLDIATVPERASANVIVTLVLDQDLPKTIRSIYGPERARSIQRSLDPQCLSGFRKDEALRIVHSEVILVSDVSHFVFASCLYEETLQALGPINDDPTVPWSMFNDEVELGFFGVYDQLLLNLLYHPHIRPGMTRDEVRAVLPAILPEVRAFVSETNGLPR